MRLRAWAGLEQAEDAVSKILESDRKYVCGFLFDPNSRVLLISKLRPDWQVGKLNGVGGRVEEDETEVEAMRRECIEETGIDCKNWQLFCVLRDARGWLVYFYYGAANIYAAQRLTDELPVIIECRDLDFDGRVIPNLRWLIPMAQSMRHESISYFNIEEVA